MFEAFVNVDTVCGLINIVIPVVLGFGLYAVLNRIGVKTIQLSNDGVRLNTKNTSNSSEEEE